MSFPKLRSRLTNRGALLAAILLVLVIAAVRLPFWAEIPRGLNRDEAALGYNAWTLAQAGVDEYSQAWPASITSFGDQKLPGYVYTLVPFVKIGGLSDWVIKLPSFLAGLTIIVSGAMVAGYILPDKQRSRGRWLTAFLLAISPWGLHFSHVAYEAHLALATFLGGTWALLHASTSPPGRGQRSRLWLAAALWSGSLLTYHSYQVLIPLLLVAAVIFWWPQIWRWDRAGVIGGLLIGLFTLIVMGRGGVWAANQTKFQGISPYRPEILARQYAVVRQAIPGDTLLERILANRTTAWLAVLGRQLGQGVALDTFFVARGAHGVHNPSGVPLAHPLMAPLVLMGLVVWGRAARRQRQAAWLLTWVALSFVAPALTIDPQHTVRLSPLLPALEIALTLGLLHVDHQWRPPGRTAGRLIFLGLMTILTLNLLTQYWWVAPQQDQARSHERFVMLAQALQRYSPQTDRVITQNPAESPYIWYLYQTSWPVDQLAAIERYPADAEGFQHVARVGNVWFATIDWNQIEHQGRTETQTLIFKPTEIPREKKTDLRYIWRENLRDRTGQVQYEVWQIGPNLL